MKNKNPCEGCTKCCEYICIEIDKPENKEDYDEIKWYLLHRDVWVFIDNDNSWNIQFNTKCMKLQDGKCGYYEQRPHICRAHSADECEKYGEGDSFKVLFKSLEEFEKWVEDGSIIPKD